MKLKLIAMMAFAVTLFGCAADGKITRSDTPVNDPTMSPALQIYKAAGIPGKMRDMPAGELAKYRGAEDPSRVPSAVLAAGTATTALPTPTGVNYGAGTTITAINFLFGGAHDQSYWNRLIFWIPESEYAALGDNPGRALLWKVANWMGGSLPEGYRIDTRQITVRGKDYDVPAIVTTDGSLVAMIKATANSFERAKSPSVAGGFDGYSTKGGFYIYLNRELTHDVNEIAFDKLPFDGYQFFKRLSERMPSWAYVYVAPREGLSKVPVMLHQGNELYFEKPEIAQTVRPPAASSSGDPG